MSHIMFKFFNVDLVIILIVYLLISYGEMGAGIFAFGQGLLIDIFSGGLLGLFTLLYLIIFLGMKLGSSSFNLLAVRGQIFIISLAVLIIKHFTKPDFITRQGTRVWISGLPITKYMMTKALDFYTKELCELCSDFNEGQLLFMLKDKVNSFIRR